MDPRYWILVYLGISSAPGFSEYLCQKIVLQNMALNRSILNASQESVDVPLVYCSRFFLLGARTNATEVNLLTNGTSIPGP